MQQGLFYKQHHGYSMQHDTHFALKRDFCGLQTPSPGTLQLPAMLWNNFKKEQTIGIAAPALELQ